MKRFITFFLVLSLLASSLVFSGCHFRGKDTEDGFYDPNTKTEYAYCTPMKLYPVNHGEEEYLTINYEDGTKTVFYTVDFEDPLEFICYEDSGYYFLARNKDIEEPSVSEFNPIAASIYGSSNLNFLASFYADNEYLPDELKEHNPTEDTWLCQMVAEYITEGENVSVPAKAEDLEDLYYIRLLSQDYPGLYYLISFFGYNGRYFLRDSSINKTVYCPRDIVIRMVGE